MKLSKSKKSQLVKISVISNPVLKKNLIRIGIKEGDIIKVIQKISKGPILIRHISQEIALGNEFGESIEVESLDA